MLTGVFAYTRARGIHWILRKGGAYFGFRKRRGEAFEKPDFKKRRSEFEMDLDGERCARPNYLSPEWGHCFRRGEKARRPDAKIPRQNDSNFARFTSDRFCLLHKNASGHTGERLGKNRVL